MGDGGSIGPLPLSGQCGARLATTARHRAITSSACALAFVTPSTCRTVGATSASCIAIAAAIIAVRALSSVGGALGG